MSDTAAILAIAKRRRIAKGPVLTQGGTSEDAADQAAMQEYLDEQDGNADFGIGPTATTYGPDQPADQATIQNILAHNHAEPHVENTGEPRLWPEIRTIIETHIRNQPRSQQVELGPSELGTTCLHCLGAKLAGWPQASQQAGWLAFEGTAIHAQFEQLFPTLNKTGFDPNADNVRFETEKKVTAGHLNGLYGGYEIGGHIDLFDRQNAATIDWKCVGNTTIRTVKANGPSQQYQVQASLYGLGLQNAEEPIRRSCIYFLPRNGVSLNDAIAWEADWDPQPGKWALARAQLLVNLMDCIEQAEGPDVRDAWISQLPKATDHCFDCGTWPDDGALSEFNNSDSVPVPQKWVQLLPLLEPQYSGDKR